MLPLVYGSQLVASELTEMNKSQLGGEWLAFDESLPIHDIMHGDIYSNRLIARIPSAESIGEILLFNTSSDINRPNIGIVYVNPRISRGRTPVGSFLSPAELFTAFEAKSSIPDILSVHHRSLSELGIFDSEIRSVPRPLWDIPDPNLPPEYGPNSLCQSPPSFSMNWSWFSSWHGVVNHSAALEMWTGWSVLTGLSLPRAVALCMSRGNDVRARAQYIIQNRINGGEWRNIYVSDLLGPGSGVGFQVYGPNLEQTRILLNTEDDLHHVFWAGASWGSPQEWISTAQTN